MHSRRILSSLGFVSVLLLTVLGFIFTPGDTALASGSGTITVVSPGAGQTWTMGSQQTISWNYSGVSDSKVTITLFKGGKSKMHIASSTAVGSNGTGTYTWTIPSTLAEGSDYQVKVLSSHCPDGGWSGNFTISTDSSFTNKVDNSTQTTQIQNASLTLVSPGNGDVWTQGSEQTIKWNYTGDPGSQVTVTLLKAGKNVIHIASKTGTGVNGLGSYTWTIPSTLSEGNDYQVKVLSSKCPDGDLTGYFSIVIGSSNNQGTSTTQQDDTNSGPNSSIIVILNGRPLSFDQPPVIIGGRTMVPMAAIFKALDADISWNGSTQTVNASRGDTTVILVIGMESALVNGHETQLNPPAQIIGGRTMVPLAFVAQALGAQVNWNGTTKTITITQSNTGSQNNETQATGSQDNATQSDTATGSDTSQFTGRQIIEKFFSLVDSGDISSAITLLDSEALGDSASQEMWKNSLSCINSAEIKSIDESNKSDWPEDFEQYKVIVSVQVDSSGQTLWSTGQETRWISLIKVNSQWKIQEIATGE